MVSPHLLPEASSLRAGDKGNGKQEDEIEDLQPRADRQKRGVMLGASPSFFVCCN